MPSTTESTIVSIAASTTKETSVFVSSVRAQQDLLNQLCSLKFKLKLGVKKRLKSSLNLELSHHMEQIQIRQPKMPAAQSFIQILGTYLAILFVFLAAYFSKIKNGLLN